jgi:hypothetical protein
MWAAAERYQHFDLLNELGKAIAFPRSGADRTFLFTEVGITHNSPSFLVVGVIQKDVCLSMPRG